MSGIARVVYFAETKLKLDMNSHWFLLPTSTGWLFILYLTFVDCARHVAYCMSAGCLPILYEVMSRPVQMTIPRQYVL